MSKWEEEEENLTVGYAEVEVIIRSMEERDCVER